jgi:hypothetical protein
VIFSSDKGSSTVDSITVDVPSNSITFPPIYSYLGNHLIGIGTDWLLENESFSKSEADDYLLYQFKRRDEESRIIFYFRITQIRKIIGKLKVFVNFPLESTKIHQSHINQHDLFCGFIPAECPLCFKVGISPVYLTREAVFNPVIVNCLNC